MKTRMRKAEGIRRRKAGVRRVEGRDERAKERRASRRRRMPALRRTAVDEEEAGECMVGSHADCREVDSQEPT